MEQTRPAYAHKNDQAIYGYTQANTKESYIFLQAFQLKKHVVFTDRTK